MNSQTSQTDFSAGQSCVLIYGDHGVRHLGTVVEKASKDRIVLTAYRHDQSPRNIVVQRDGRSWVAKGRKCVNIRLANDKEAATIARYREKAATMTVEEGLLEIQDGEEGQDLAKKAAPSAKAKTSQETHKCLCGCGQDTKGIWFPSHDSKAHSILRKVVKGELGHDAIPAGLKASYQQVGFIMKHPELLALFTN